MILALEGLVEELRRVGLPISVSEKIDAAQALSVVNLSDRGAVKGGLAATLVKNSEHQSAFDTVFDLYFSQRAEQSLVDQLVGEGGGEGEGEGLGTSGPDGEGYDPDGGGGSGGGGLASLDDDTLRQLLVDSIAAGDGPRSLLQRRLAQLLVARHAGIQPGRAVAGTYYLFRAMRALKPDLVLARLVTQAAAKTGDLDALSHRLQVEGFEQGIAGFQQEVEAEIRRRLVADRGADAVAKTLRRPLPEDVDFLTASAEQMRALRDVLTPLSRKLASRMGERRKHKREGGVDFRKTIRRSLSSGGVPLDLYFHKPRPHKPELVVLADISGSVSAFAGFTLQLTSALRSQFARVRSFVFVDGLDEVTDLVANSHEITEVTAEINRRGLGVWFDGRSDYGNAIDTFWERHGQDLRHRTTVLVLGDARTNYHSPRAEILAKVAKKAGHVYWLNPEPKASWDSGDSVIGQYAKVCDETLECRNVRQLKQFIDRLE